MMTSIKSRTRWTARKLLPQAIRWRDKNQQRLSAVHKRSYWWPFIHDWPRHFDHWLTQFQMGLHQFSPMKQYACKNLTVHKSMIYSREALLIGSAIFEMSNTVKKCHLLRARLSC